MNMFSHYSMPRVLNVANDMALADAAENPIAQSWMKPAADHAPQSTVDANQIASLNALIAYLATQSGQSEFRVERNLADRFQIPSIKVMPASQFDQALHYLIDTVKV